MTTEANKNEYTQINVLGNLDLFLQLKTVRRNSTSNTYLSINPIWYIVKMPIK